MFCGPVRRTFFQLHAKRKLIIGFAFGFTLNWPLPKLLRFSEFGFIILGIVLSDPRLSVLAVTHIGHSKQNWVKRLACSVFELALRDCGLSRYHGRIDRKLQRDAVHFLTDGGEMFRFWCQALNKNPDRMQSALRRRLAQS